MDQDQGAPEDLQDLRLARDLQEMRLSKKRRQTVRPLPGSLFLAKTSGVARIPLQAAVNGLPPGRYSPQQVRSALLLGPWFIMYLFNVHF